MLCLFFDDICVPRKVPIRAGLLRCIVTAILKENVEKEGSDSLWEDVSFEISWSLIESFYPLSLRLCYAPMTP